MHPVDALFAVRISMRRLFDMMKETGPSGSVENPRLAVWIMEHNGALADLAKALSALLDGKLE